MAAAPRISLAWILIAILIGLVLFFGYHIYTVGDDSSAQPIAGSMDIVKDGKIASPVIPHNDPVYAIPKEELIVHNEPLDVHVEERPMPMVVGQTEEELKMTSPLAETPPAVEYADPEAKDPLEREVHSESEFGSNLRHPEQMIEMHPPMGTMRVPAAGLGSEGGSVGGNESVQYTPEFATNGGEFMNGIFAFDGSDAGGIGYSMI
jgi:hypothetical protein